MSSNDPGDPSEKKKGPPNINDVILKSMRSRAGKETSHWITDLTAEGMDEMVLAASGAHSAANLQRQPTSADLCKTSLVMPWVDKLFDLFQQYEVEFNRVAGGTERIETERPNISAELLQKLQSGASAYFTGRVHTRQLSFVFKGNFNRIACYIVPSDHMLAFSVNESLYQPVLQMDFVWQGQELVWNCNGAPISFDMIPTLAKQLFGYLIRTARSDDGRPFVFQGPVASAPGTPPAKARSTGKHQKLNLPLAKPTNLTDDSLTNIPGLSSLPADFRTNVGSSTSDFRANSVTPRASSVRLSSDLARENTGQVSRPSVEPNFDQALDLVLRSLDRELERMSQDGASAFVRQDMTEVERNMRRTNKFKSIREKIVSDVADWRRLMQQS